MSFLDDYNNLQKARELFLKKLPKPKLTSERARLVTEAYKKIIGEPMIARRAKYLKNNLNEMTIYKTLGAYSGKFETRTSIRSNFSRKRR